MRKFSDKKSEVSMDCTVPNSAHKETVNRSRSPEAAVTNLRPISFKCQKVAAADEFHRSDESRRPGQSIRSSDPSQAKPSQAKVLTGGGDLREAQVDVPLSVSHSCV